VGARLQLVEKSGLREMQPGLAARLLLTHVSATPRIHNV
jgi:hypothetical protein